MPVLTSWPCDLCDGVTRLESVLVRFVWGRHRMSLCANCLALDAIRKRRVGPNLPPIGAQTAPPAGAIVADLPAPKNPQPSPRIRLEEKRHA